MKLNYITIFVKNLEKTLHFYTELVNLKVVNRIHLPQGEIAFCTNKEEETMLEFIQFPHVKPIHTSHMIFSFLTDISLELLREQMISLGYTPSEIINQPPKSPYLKVHDTNGIEIEFTQK